MRLDDNVELFKEVIENTAINFHVLNEYVEKDYWITLLLKEIFKHNNDYVFKGGTSLSKCHHLINRFSEDIDISYEKPYSEIGISEIERKYKGISSSIKTVEQYALYVHQSSGVIYKQMDDKGIIDDLTNDYEDLHGMSSIYLNEYIDSLMR